MRLLHPSFTSKSCVVSNRVHQLLWHSICHNLLRNDLWHSQKRVQGLLFRRRVGSWTRDPLNQSQDDFVDRMISSGVSVWDRSIDLQHGVQLRCNLLPAEKEPTDRMIRDWKMRFSNMASIILQREMEGTYNPNSTFQRIDPGNPTGHELTQSQVIRRQSERSDVKQYLTSLLKRHAL